MQFTEQHQQIRNTVRQFVEKEINPHVDKWEADG
ncbi:MAG: acyl-CoA dehydrogenase family protein, partial [Halieaceae bacterium]|nr:acyl-CoA dehydrogenase family protein [Halieaceae bacterium]